MLPIELLSSVSQLLVSGAFSYLVCSTGQQPVKEKSPCYVYSSFYLSNCVIRNHGSKQDTKTSLVLRVSKRLTIDFGYDFCYKAELKNKEKGTEERRGDKTYTERGFQVPLRLSLQTQRHLLQEEIIYVNQADFCRIS